jgi:hypothetical protein
MLEVVVALVLIDFLVLQELLVLAVQAAVVAVVVQLMVKEMVLQELPI